MNRLHLPEIENLHDNSVGGTWIANKNLTTGQVSVTTTRNGNSSRNKRRSVVQEQVTWRKREKVEKSRRVSTKKLGGKVRNTRSEGKNQIVQKRNEIIGFPNIGSSAGARTKNKSDFDGLGPKRSQRWKVRGDDQGDTISYVYSKSLKDKNCMAFLRNGIDFENGAKNYRRPSGSAADKKPYGLPSLKTSGEFADKVEWSGKDLGHEISTTKSGSFLNG